MSDPAPNFDDIVDDDPLPKETVEWAIEQLLDGREFDQVGAELVESGWPAEQAERIVEEARKQTRNERGVITRETVNRAVTANYRAGTGAGLFSAFPTIASMR